MKIFQKGKVRRAARTVVVQAVNNQRRPPSTESSGTNTSQPTQWAPTATSAPKAFNVENSIIRALGKIDMKNQKITSLATPTEAGDAVNLIYLQSYVNDRYVRKDDAQNFAVKRVGSPIDKTDAANKGYVDDQLASVIKLQNKHTKFICIPSTDKNVSGSLMLRDVKLLNAVLQLPNPEKSKLYLLTSGERGKIDKRELKVGKAMEYEINLQIETYTTVFFEVQPPVTILPSITLYYVDNIDNIVTQ